MGEYFEGKNDHHYHRDSHKDRSLWKKIRMLYKDGYVVLGELQDLLSVTYTDALYNKRLDKVNKWRTKFMGFQKKYRVRRFLYSDYSTGVGGIDPHGHYFHSSSHLFWSKTSKD